MSEVHEEVVETTAVTNGEDPNPSIKIENGLASVEGAIEARARRMGWVPRTEFASDTIHWIDAKSFVERAEGNANILIERNRALDKKLEKTESEIAKLNTSNTALQEQIKDLASVTTELRNFASTANERAYKRAKSEIEASMRQAVSEADVPKFEQARAELDQLNQDAIDAGARKVEPKTEPKVEPKVEPKTEVATPQQQQQLAPEVVTFIDANPWFLSDGTLNTYMQDRHLTLQREEPGLTLTQNLAKAKKQVQDKFPERFGINPNREAAPAVSTTTTTRVAKTKKLGYDDLPADAKAMCDKFVKTIPPKRDRETGKMVPYSREEYLQTYFGDQEV